MPHAALRPITMAAIALGCLGCLDCLPGIPRARAQDASAWEIVPHAAARLIAGASHKSADDVWLRAGIEVRLESGWHTYWRYPGDSGVPPTFDFAGSDNVKSVVVLWPAPERLLDGAAGHSIGYHGDVVFPLRITALDTTKPSSLHLKLGYAVCSNLCLPAEANLELTLSGKSGTEESVLVAAEARVPRRVPLGANTGFAIRSVHRESGDGGERVVVEVAAPEAIPVDLLVEGPTPDWALPLPGQTNSTPGSASGVQRFTFNLDGLPPGAHAVGATLTFTAVSPDDAIEISAHLD
jgi:DsbC/DsbD-like thiol-disulfide interchange protein